MTRMPLCNQLEKLNPGKKFFVSDIWNCIVTDCDLNSIVCPEGFYVRNIDAEDHLAEITNKHNTNGYAYEQYGIHQCSLRGKYRKY